MYEVNARRKGRKKGKGGDSAKRSALLRLVMPFLSGKAGEALAEAATGDNPERFRALWNEASKKIFEKLSEGDKKVEANDGLEEAKLRIAKRMSAEKSSTERRKLIQQFVTLSNR